MHLKKSMLRPILLVIFCSSILHSQQSILLNQSAYNLYVLCPAALGLNNNMNINCHYKKNWLGLNESPELIQLTLDGTSTKNTGLGLSILNEKAGMFSKTSFSGAFNYKINFNSIHFLRVGIAAGFQKQQSDFSKINADAPEEFSQWSQQQSVVIPDASFGIAYSFHQLFVSATVSQLLQNNFSYKSSTTDQELYFKTIPQFVFSFQNTFIIKPDYWSFIPHLTLRTPQGLPVQYDILNSLLYKNKLLFGIGYRNSYAIYMNLGYNINEKLRITYSYEYSLGIQTTVNGGHEIGLCFEFQNKKNKINSTEDVLSENKLKSLYEELDQQNQEVEKMSKKIESLDKNIVRLLSELERLKSKQVNETEINEEIKSYLSKKEPLEPDSVYTTKTPNRFVKEEKHKVISPKNETDFNNITDSSTGNYKIVFGVYQLLNYAKEYQKFLQRELGMETKLIQLSGHPKKYIYVCEVTEYYSLQKALLNLKISVKIQFSMLLEHHQD